MRFAKDLEAITNAGNKTALLGVGHDCVHDRREPGNRSGAEVVSIRESAGKDYAVIAFERCFGMPDVLDRLVEHVFDGVIGILVAVRAGKPDYGELHLTTSNR